MLRFTAAVIMRAVLPQYIYGVIEKLFVEAHAVGFSGPVGLLYFESNLNDRFNHDTPSVTV